MIFSCSRVFMQEPKHYFDYGLYSRNYRLKLLLHVRKCTLRDFAKLSAFTGNVTFGGKFMLFFGRGGGGGGGIV